MSTTPSSGRYERYRYLAVQVENEIATIMINRPDAMNACRTEDHGELADILVDIAADDEVRVAIVTGAGRAFSVGGDLTLLQDMIDEPDRLPQLMEEGRRIIEGHLALTKPIIAAVNGYAMGAGLAFALMCDIVIADRSAKLADGHIRAGLAAGDGGTVAWPLSVGMMKAKRYLLTGDWIDAVEAERIGLITEVVDDGTTLDRAMVYASRLAAGPQQAIRWTKQALNEWSQLASTATFNYSLGLEIATFGTADFRSAVVGLRENGRGAIPPER
jgi:enoyl-CoA hydratase